MLTATELTDLSGRSLVLTATGTPQPINDLLFADEHADTAAGDLLLGAGVATQISATDLVSAAGRAEAAGVILRRRWATDPEVVALAASTKTALLCLDDSFSWAHLVAMIQSIIDRDTAGTSAVHNDLFAIADAAAQILEAPVTIEDSRSRVLAYSLHHEPPDTARVSTIIGRRVPDRIISHFRSQGLFRRLSRSDEPIYVPAGPDGTLPRLVIPIRAGGEWLGSIWAAVHGPAAPEQVHELAGATRALALHLLRLRSEANVDRRLSTAQIRAALSDPGATLPSGVITFPCRVVALTGTLTGEPDTDHEMSVWISSLQRSGWAQPVVADLGAAVYVIVAEPTSTAHEPGSWAWLREVVEHAMLTNQGLRASASAPVAARSGLAGARLQADEALTLTASGRLGIFEEQWRGLTVQRALSALTSWHELATPLQPVIEHDAAHGSDLLGSLSAFLGHGGDTTAAAGVLHVHPNTLRYRMKKVRELIEPESLDPTAWLALALLCRAALRKLTPDDRTV